ncbi:hypothetical protein QBC47DRAFT_374547 [Echria macrotheca]|uniref:Elongator complex protein 6 n=1 Tax=Echria macrotheca TaxID=438768 RepID=A0AAJ0F8V5_9PEZI|nr:hypothetical protein QBC47DRAFT_374547 [Echria macrotheca]
MTSRTTIPPLLDPYLSLPDETSLIVLTSVLGASTNWLVLRFLHSLLKSSPSSLPPSSPRIITPDGPNGGQQQKTSIILLSFLRDFPFWRETASRLGVDLEAHTRRGSFTFIDGLSNLFSSPSGSSTPTPTPSSSSSSPPGGKYTLSTPTITELSKTLHKAVDDLRCRSGGAEPKIVLVIDQLDLLLASTSTSTSSTSFPEGNTSQALRDMLLDLREKTHTTILTLSADDPLLNAQTTTLEKDHAAFVLSLAHEARMLMSLRLLDTGTAKDVSGVLRITNGGDDVVPVEEREYLYHVGGDGGVRVFERGQ